MSKTRVVNIALGHRYDVYIGRAGKGQDVYFGNPFRLVPGESRGATIEKYRSWFYRMLTFEELHPSARLACDPSRAGR